MTYVADAARYSVMNYRRSGRSGLKLPELSLGLWQNFGDTCPLEFSAGELEEIDRAVKP
jgi:L-glyceraldehyde 3-phosphate reductase